MAKLNAAARNALPSKDFGLPGERKYPEQDKAHARDAKSRASAAYKRGQINDAEFKRINAKADTVLGS